MSYRATAQVQKHTRLELKLLLFKTIEISVVCAPIEEQHTLNSPAHNAILEILLLKKKIRYLVGECFRIKIPRNTREALLLDA